ncbi:MAG: response regulator transcription factor [Planctomycetota bacterium]|jgi:DNA-binding response OmpR family regulator
MKTVLIVDDNPAMLRGLGDNFESKGYRVRTARDGEQGLNITLRENPDLIILDIVLPKINGYEMCSLIRKRNLDMPIIMLTAKNSESDIVRGLTLGADDYITKPFSIRELLARAEAFMRRRKEEAPPICEFGDCQLDIRARILRRDGREVKLSPKEFEMLRLFVRKPGCILTRDEILSTVWGYSHFVTLRGIDNFVTSLRNKVEPDPKNPTFIRTVGDVGYKFEPQESNGNGFDS